MFPTGSLDQTKTRVYHCVLNLWSDYSISEKCHNAFVLNLLESSDSHCLRIVFCYYCWILPGFLANSYISRDLGLPCEELIYYLKSGCILELWSQAGLLSVMDTTILLPNPEMHHYRGAPFLTPWLLFIKPFVSGMLERDPGIASLPHF